MLKEVVSYPKSSMKFVSKVIVAIAVTVSKLFYRLNISASKASKASKAIK